MEPNYTLLVAERQASIARAVRDSGYRHPASGLLKHLARKDQASDSLLYDAPDATPDGDFQPSTGDGTCCQRFKISSVNKDRMGDYVVPQGCQEHLKTYQANPVVFFSHKSYALPIGSAVDKDGKFHLEIEPDKALYSTVRFHLKTQESEDVARMVEARELRCASIGFMPHLAQRMEGDELTAAQAAEVAGDVPIEDLRSFEGYFSYKFLKWELYEWSVVPVPANADCIAMRLSRGFGGKRLSDGVARVLTPYAAPLKELELSGWEAPKIQEKAPGPQFTPDEVKHLKELFQKSRQGAPPPPVGVEPVTPEAEAGPVTPDQLKALEALAAGAKALAQAQKTLHAELRKVTGKVD